MNAGVVAVGFAPGYRGLIEWQSFAETPRTGFYLNLYSFEPQSAAAQSKFQIQINTDAAA